MTRFEFWTLGLTRRREAMAEHGLTLRKATLLPRNFTLAIALKLNFRRITVSLLPTKN
jgi:hypothetical protein